MDNLDGYISEIKKELDVIDVYWKGNFANVIKEDIRGLVAYSSDSQNLSLKMIKKQIEILSLINYRKDYLVGKLNACAKAEDDYNNAIDAARASNIEDIYTYAAPYFKVYSNNKVDMEDEYKKLKELMNQISNLSLQTLNRKAESVNEYKINCGKIQSNIFETLNNLYALLLTLYTQVEATLDTETFSARGNHIKSHTFQKTVMFSVPKNKVLKNLEKIINRLDKLRIKITDHLNNIIQLENGKSFELAGITEGTEEKTPIVKEEKYTVQAGDSLASIGSKYDKSWQEIYEANKSVIGDSPNIIYSGMNLVIPGVNTSDLSELKETINNSLGNVELTEDYKPIGTYKELVK